MKTRKIVSVFVVAMLITMCLPSFAQSKYYKDYSTGYNGYAGAIYVDRKRAAPLKDIHYDSIHWTDFEKGVPVDKLTNEEVWLLWQALGEYDYRVGEVYNIFVGHRPKIIFITVEITGKDVCSYCATYILTN